MSIISSQFLLAPGLENATNEQKADCVKDKAINGLKHAAVNTAVGLAAGGSIYALATNKNVQDGAVKVADKAKGLLEKGAAKIGKSGIMSKASELFQAGCKKLGVSSKTGKLGLIAGGVALVGGLIGSAIQLHNIHQSGKIEGQHQAKVDAANAEA